MPPEVSEGQTYIVKGMWDGRLRKVLLSPLQSATTDVWKSGNEQELQLCILRGSHQKHSSNHSSSVGL